MKPMSRWRFKVVLLGSEVPSYLKGNTFHLDCEGRIVPKGSNRAVFIGTENEAKKTLERRLSWWSYRYGKFGRLVLEKVK